MTTLLRPATSALTFLTTTLVHPVYFPYPWVSTLHAIRISLVYQANVRWHQQQLAHNDRERFGKKISWPAYIAGYLMMCWGGLLASHSLLSLPPPIVYTVHPYVNYVVPFLFIAAAPTPLCQYILSWEWALVPLDALLRANAVLSTVSMVHTLPLTPLLTTSPLFHAILGACASSGGSVLASTLQTHTPDWKLGTPPFLTAGWIASLDVWGGALVGIFGAWAAFPELEMQTALLGDGGGLTVLESKALAVYLFGVLFAWRVWVAKAARVQKQKVQ